MLGFCHHNSFQSHVQIPSLSKESFHIIHSSALLWHFFLIWPFTCTLNCYTNMSSSLFLNLSLNFTPPWNFSNLLRTDFWHIIEFTTSSFNLPSHYKCLLINILPALIWTALTKNFPSLIVSLYYCQTFSYRGYWIYLFSVDPGFRIGRYGNYQQRLLQHLWNMIQHILRHLCWVHLCPRLFQQTCAFVMVPR